MLTFLRHPSSPRCLIALTLLLVGPISAQVGPEAPEPELAAGQRFIPTPVYSAAEDKAVLEAFQGLRVADVSDGLDALGFFGNMLMDPAIHPLWKDPENYRHRIVGIAVTARYMPANEPLPGQLSTSDYDAWAGSWYHEKSSEPFTPLLREGSVVVIDDSENDVGSIGSANILNWVRLGAVGVVTDSTARDTDEIITQRIPLYFRGPGRGIRPGRNEIESVNLPVVIGGVQVRPGDLIVADGDGVLCVPREVALAVAAYAHNIIEGDKNARRDLYRALGIPADPSIQ
jgi:4-hydroxy-4-methyl-2-oxoglutarate aldolase